MKLKTKCKKKWTNCKKSQFPVSSCLQNNFLDDPLRDSEFGIRDSKLVICSVTMATTAHSGIRRRRPCCTRRKH